MKKRIRELVKAQQQERLLKKKSETEKLKEEGIQFPSHNPVPKREEELTKKEKIAADLLKQKESKRKQERRKVFVGWEYKDRYSYKKLDE